MSRYVLCGFIVCALAGHAISREIPIADVYATGGERKLLTIPVDRSITDDGQRYQYTDARHRLSRRADGASNALLIDAADITEAVRKTARVLAGALPADTTSLPGSKLTGVNWFVVYLGCGHSSPPKWIVEGASIEGNRIRLTYQKPKVRGHTEDIHQYYYWIPLGKLDAAAYNLELYDLDLKAVTLMRRVEVKAP